MFQVTVHKYSYMHTYERAYAEMKARARITPPLFEILSLEIKNDYRSAYRSLMTSS